jgi:ribose transport system permease protein
MHAFVELRGRASAAAPALVLGSLVLLIGSLEPTFLQLTSLKQVMADASVLLLIAAGQTLIVLTGRIDLSICALTSACTVLLAKLMQSLDAGAVPVVLAVAAAVGAAQGWIHVRAQLPSFVVTLGGLFLFSGLALILGDAKAISVPYGHNPVDVLAGDRMDLWLPNSAVFGLVVVLLGAAALRLLPFGRHVLALGVNERAAVLAGVPAARTVIATFACSGLAAGLAALVLVADFDAGRPGLADVLLLPTIAAVVVGGTAITGGVGGLGRTVVGALTIAVLRVGVNAVGAPPQYQQLLYGIIVITAVALTIDRRKLAVVK